MTQTTVLRPAQLRGRAAAFDLAPPAEALAALARTLDVPEVRTLRLSGTLEPEGREDWRLDGRLDALVVQECVVTLEPVETRVEEPVERLYVAGLDEPGTGEVEMPDEAREPLPAAIDLMAVAAEALALALPPYPRAPGAELGEAVFAEPGVEPMTEEDARPFAGLAALRGRLGGD